MLTGWIPCTAHTPGNQPVPHKCLSSHIVYELSVRSSKSALPQPEPNTVTLFQLTNSEYNCIGPRTDYLNFRRAAVFHWHSCSVFKTCCVCSMYSLARLRQADRQTDRQPGRQAGVMCIKMQQRLMEEFQHRTAWQTQRRVLGMQHCQVPRYC